MQRLTAKIEFPSYKILYPPKALVITALFKCIRYRFLIENCAERGSLSKIWFCPSAKRCKFNDLACTFWEKNHINQKQNQDLASIRDALLPKLLSGEIRVKDAKKIVEVVA